MSLVVSSQTTKNDDKLSTSNRQVLGVPLGLIIIVLAKQGVGAPLLPKPSRALAMRGTLAPSKERCVFTLCDGGIISEPRWWTIVAHAERKE
ncbi:hypothetical protein Micbo1qcDRAFT_155435 [Microdochium bolleyi]|uniref:Uncharacterized protein n=1 Tax=Microdochium bolleyi TaxID=196109 RepID=A0A136JI16_9PEZI|nr:hypothetical protein Micbo1qcDRAFT_155435 [Microdochium bolleyi]